MDDELYEDIVNNISNILKNVLKSNVKTSHLRWTELYNTVNLHNLKKYYHIYFINLKE